MRVLIVTAGSRGDVAPYTGLGGRLHAAGHQVALAAHPSYAELAAGCGLDFRPIPGDLRALQASANGRLHRSDTRGLIEFVRVGTRFVGELGDGIAAAADGGMDLMLLSATAAPLGYSVAERHGIPSLGVFLQPVQPTGDFPPMVLGARSLGGWGNRIAGQWGHALGRSVYAAASRRLRARLGLAPANLRSLDRRCAALRWPILHGFSPTVVPRPADWRPGLDVVGYWWPEPRAPWQPPPELVDFLSAGPPPVFVGFGSMVGAVDRLTALVGSALRAAGLRGIIQSDVAGAPALATKDMITIGEAPHDWLFPHVAAVVHHAGAGTTAAGLRAGVPAVPVPMMADQPFWANRLAMLGVSPAIIPAHRLSAARLTAAIQAAVSDPSYAHRARAIAVRLAAEDGTGAVVRAVERLAR
jgi:UDP:flavonoid glycosyltransferase YjiC (YdhE family)